MLVVKSGCGLVSRVVDYAVKSSSHPSVYLPIDLLYYLSIDLS